jgi:hypothetical protein
MNLYDSYISGTLTVSGAIVPTANIAFDLGTTSNQWRHLYVGSGSVYMGGNRVLGLNNDGSIQLGLQTVQTSASLATYTATGGTATNAFTGAVYISGSLNVSNNLIVTGSITAQQYIISSSVSYFTESFASGSNKFGDTIDDYHDFTGSLRVTGSLTTTGNMNLTGSLTIGNNNPSTTQLNVFTSSVSTQNVMTEFYNNDYTSGTRNFLRVRNQISVGSSMSSYFGQGQDGKTYIVANDFTKNHIVIDGNSTYVGINKNTPNAQLDVNGSAILSGSLTVINSASSTTAIFRNTSSTSNSNIQLGNDIGTNQAGMALFGSGFSSSAQYRANGAYVYSNLSGGLTLHAEGANSLYLATNGTAAITINSSQNTTFAGTITENSSIRYKDNIETVKYGLDKVLQMRGVTYTKKDTGLQELGLIAEEINEILPEVVLKNEEGEPDSVSYGRITAVLIEAIKEQQKQIEELKALIK